MARILIRGGNRLSGTLPISGAKNAALTLLPCALLTDEPLTLRNLPRLADVDSFGHLLNQLGASTAIEGSRPEDFGRVMTIRAGKLTSTEAPYDIVRKMRASILVLGPILARAGEARGSLPGGCAIGNRPIDLHLKALEAIGAELEMSAGYVTARAPGGRLSGGRYSFPIVSVGATENVVMAAVTAKGSSRIENAAREPEIVDLCRCLVAMGAQIEGIGSETLEIEGVERLHGATYAVMPDRIEAGSYACAAAITGGDIELTRGAARGGGAGGGGQALGARLRQRAASAADALHCALPRLRHRHAGAVHGDAVQGGGRERADRDDLREPLHARPGAGADGRGHPGARAHGGGAGGRSPRRRAGDGDRPARLDEPDPRRPCGGGRDGGEPRLSPRSRIRATGGEAERGRRGYRARQRRVSGPRRQATPASFRALP